MSTLWHGRCPRTRAGFTVQRRAAGRRVAGVARHRERPAHDRAAERLPDAVREAGNDLFALALELGAVTGEHGVGLLKRDWLAREAGADVLDVHARIKSALDPRGILNPGKGF